MNEYANWWEEDRFLEKKPVKPKDDTPFEIKSHPVYKKMAERFLSGHFKDHGLEQHKKGSAHATINDDDITD